MVGVNNVVYKDEEGSMSYVGLAFLGSRQATATSTVKHKASNG